MHVPFPEDFCPVSLAHLHSILEMILIVGVKCLERKAHGNEQTSLMPVSKLILIIFYFLSILLVDS